MMNVNVTEQFASYLCCKRLMHCVWEKEWEPKVHARGVVCGVVGCPENFP